MKKKHICINAISALLLIASFVFGIKECCCTNSISTGNMAVVQYDKLSNKKIGWGIKRAKNHVQPDVGNENKKIMDEYGGLYVGNPEKKYIYLTFDAGYEAGFTDKILNVLKNNDVPATFFITGHYLNTQPDLVRKMIDAGHTIGNHTPKALMYIV